MNTNYRFPLSFLWLLSILITLIINSCSYKIKSSASETTTSGITIPTTIVSSSSTIVYPDMGRTKIPAITIIPAPSLTNTMKPSVTMETPYIDVRNKLKPGSYMVYWLEQDSSLFVRPIQEPAAIPLVPIQSIFWGADISPDGKKVAFVDLEQRLAILDMSSGNVTYVTYPRSFILRGYVRWSPDGKQILYIAIDQEQNFQEAFYLITPNDDSFVCLTPWCGFKWFPNWSPDGKWIAFSSDHSKFQGEYPPKDELYLLDTDCISSPEKCYNDLIPIGDAFGQPTTDPTWSPDGQQLAFVCALENPHGICVMNKDGSGLVQIVHRENIEPWKYSIFGLSWSPDGEYIAFTLADSTDDPDPRNYDGYNNDLFIVPSGGGEAVNVSNTQYEDEYFSFWLVIK